MASSPFNAQIYASLKPKTRKCLRRRKWRFGAPYVYRPRPKLLARVSQQFKISEEDARQELLKIRKFLLSYPQYF